MKRLLIAAAIVACHSSSTSKTVDGPPADGADPCAEACLTRGWWLGVSSNCSTVCMGGNASLTECMQTDCEVIEASRYTTMRQSLAPMLFSANARSFYLVGSLTSKSYSASGCMLQIGSASPETFSCSAASLTLPTAMLSAASDTESGALDAAATANAPGHYTY